MTRDRQGGGHRRGDIVEKATIGQLRRGNPLFEHRACARYATAPEKRLYGLLLRCGVEQELNDQLEGGWRRELFQRHRLVDTIEQFEHRVPVAAMSTAVMPCSMSSARRNCALSRMASMASASLKTR
ncbi:hypothetical protein [Gemmatimonas sp.]|uniref:hypothetical protein n=1 Tax=Gemmatimonas sp. TaxID=1962908 RepID=UPI003DA6ACC4